MTQEVDGPDGRKLAVEVTGAPPGRHAVFMLHGTPGSLSGPRPRGIYLHRLGIRLISYNRPGYPGSTRNENRAVADAAADVKAIADQLGIHDFSVIGRSGGAPHALAVAASESLAGRVKCVAALSSLAPFDVDTRELDWFEGMVKSNVYAYRDLAKDPPALSDNFSRHAEKVRANSQGLLNALWPELVGADKQVIGDVSLRRLIARTHAEALRESVDGWVDDVVALGKPWGFDLSAIELPVLLWHGVDDVFSPPAHTEWLAKKIVNATHYFPREEAHFGAVEILPEVLSWVLSQVQATESLPSRFAGNSERLGVNHGQQTPLISSGTHVGMVGSDLR